MNFGELRSPVALIVAHCLLYGCATNQCHCKARSDAPPKEFARDSETVPQFPKTLDEVLTQLASVRVERFDVDNASIHDAFKKVNEALDSSPQAVNVRFAVDPRCNPVYVSAHLTNAPLSEVLWIIRAENDLLLRYDSELHGDWIIVCPRAVE